MTKELFKITVYTYKNFKRLALALIESGYTVRVSAEGNLISVEVVEAPNFMEFSGKEIIQ